MTRWWKFHGIFHHCSTIFIQFSILHLVDRIKNSERYTRRFSFYEIFHASLIHKGKSKPAALTRRGDFFLRPPMCARIILCLSYFDRHQKATVKMAYGSQKHYSLVMDADRTIYLCRRMDRERERERAGLHFLRHCEPKIIEFIEICVVAEKLYTHFLNLRDKPIVWT